MLQIPETTLAGTPSTPLVDNYTVFSVSSQQNYSTTFAPFRDGLLETQEHELVYHAIDGSGASSTIEFPRNSHDLQIAASPDGSVVYLYDPARATLYRMKPWW